jgi:hypothetical protein
VLVLGDLFRTETASRRARRPEAGLAQDRELPADERRLSSQLSLDGAAAGHLDQRCAPRVIPERVGIAAGPEARLYREGLNEYGTVLQRALRRRR